ncbi:hypothetical protein N656DRAFT_517623 [Canariomyces notabilis]|uniref:Uncharacterized protein n=1 Tax=Canariomyces notabilis TaxID=2074819 RepID=A0AAN6T7P5_9PEZI|nr:hypothetical protein N656DRAFT_517623 [Canariomyces arenarius]
MPLGCFLGCSSITLWRQRLCLVKVPLGLGAFEVHFVEISGMQCSLLVFGDSRLPSSNAKPTCAIRWLCGHDRDHIKWANSQDGRQCRPTRLTVPSMEICRATTRSFELEKRDTINLMRYLMRLRGSVCLPCQDVANNPVAG